MSLAEADEVPDNSPSRAGKEISLDGADTAASVLAWIHRALLLSAFPVFILIDIFILLAREI